ncbi:unnamed protein product [Gordionus sp. m RMFG-2023]|uniref:ATP synthase subunit delta, mitochondrial-like n=1 Tax=Gordionus sp. m RMFG-2023 TaxID=3053472 RepID=UPI0030DFFD34
MLRISTLRKFYLTFVRTYADVNQLHLTLASPTKVFYNSKVVKQVDIPSFSGNFGVLANHVPILALLKPGVIKVFEEDGKINDIFVSSGTVTINSDSTCQVLAEEAIPLDYIDQSACKEALHHYQQEMSKASEDQKAELAIGIEVLETISKLA